MDDVEAYKRHVIDQALTLLKAHDTIRCLFITPKLLEALAERISLKKAGVRGVFCGGTEMTPQFHRWVREEVLEGAYFAPTYGNTLMGLATHRETGPAEDWAIVYYPPAPRAMNSSCRASLSAMRRNASPRVRRIRGTASETSARFRDFRPLSPKACTDVTSPRQNAAPSFRIAAAYPPARRESASR